MPKFIFRFEQMLNINEKLKEQKEIEYGKAVQAYELEKEKLIGYENSLQQSVVSMRDSINAKISPRMMSEYNSYIKLLKKNIEVQARVVFKAYEEVERLRVELSKALMEIKKYEKLKEKDLEEYVEEIKQKENAFVDEIVTYKYSKSDEE